MPQLHLYVSSELSEALKRKAKAQGISVSKYLAELVKREVGLDWPEHYQELLGGWQGELPKRPQSPTPQEQGSLELPS